MARGDRTATVWLTGDATGALRAMRNTGRAGDKLAKAIKRAGKIMGAGIGIAAAGVLKLAVDWDGARSSIAKATGAVGDELDGLADETNRVLGQVPESLDVVADSFGALRTLYQGADRDVGKLTERTLDFARNAGGDPLTVTNQLGRATKAWGLDAQQSSALLDTLTVAGQRFGITGEALLNQMQTFGPLFANAGYSADDTAIAMGRLHAAGIDLSRVGPALNKFWRDAAAEGLNAKSALAAVEIEIRNAKTETEALTIATEAFGAEGAQRMTSFIRNAGGSLTDFAGELDGTAGALDAATAESATFRDRLKELKNRGLAALKPIADLATKGLSRLIDHLPDTARLAEAVTAAIGKISDVVTRLRDVIGREGFLGTLALAAQRLRDWWDTAGRLRPVLIAVAAVIGGALVAGLVAVTAAVWAKVAAMTALAAATVVAYAPLFAIIGVAAALAAAAVWLYDNWEPFRTLIQRITAYIRDNFRPTVEAIAAWFRDDFIPVVRAIADAFTAAFGAVTDVVVPALAALAEAFRRNWDLISSIVKNVAKVLFLPIKNAFDVIVGVVRTLFAVFHGDWEDAWNQIKNTLGKVWDNMTGILKGKLAIVTDALKLAGRAIKRIWEAIWQPLKGLLSRVWNGLTSVFRGYVNSHLAVWQGLANGVIGVVNTVIRALNAIPEVSIPSWVPVVGGNSFGIPHIAEIGRVNIPRLADGGIATRPTLALIGEAGPEAVIPLPTATAMTRPSPDRRDSPPVEVEVVVQLDAATIARALSRHSRVSGPLQIRIDTAA